MSRNRSHGIMVALLFGTLALIAYGSLYPFDLRADARSISIWHALGQLTWARSGRGDRIANVLLYVPLGFCLLLSLDSRFRRRFIVLFAVAFGFALSYSIEVAQVFIPPRVASYWDVVFNVIGSFVGAAAGIAWRELSSRLSDNADTRVRAHGGAIFIVFLWLAWRLWPFVPQFSIGRLKAAFTPLADPYFSVQLTLHYLAWWMLLAHVVFSLVRGQRGIEALLVLIAVVLAACLGVNYHGFIPSELLALVALLPTLFLVNRLTPTPRHIFLLGIFVALLLFDSLSPPHVGVGRFDPWPFLGWIDRGYPIDWEWLARRACYFAMFVWVLREAGLSARSTTIFVPVVVLAIEIIRTLMNLGGSITEPAIAIAVAWIMQALDAPRGATLQRARSR